MKFKGLNFSYVLYIILFILIRFINKTYDGSIYEQDLIGMSVASSSFPFGIIKEEFSHGLIFSLYYFIVHIFAMFNLDILYYKVFNTILNLFTTLLLYKTGKLLLNKYLGLFVALFICLNKYFIFYSCQITGFALNCFIFSLILYLTLVYLKKFDLKTLKILLFISILYCFFDNIAIFFLASQLLVIACLFINKPRMFNKYLSELGKYKYAILFLFILFTAQNIFLKSKLMPDNLDAVALNLNSTYLMLSDFFSPLMSFNSLDDTHYSVLGLMYSYFINNDSININSLKILITLFYTAVLPVVLFFILTLKVVYKNSRLKLLFYIGVLYLFIILFLMFLNIVDVNPGIIYPFFVIMLIVSSYGLLKIKDYYIKLILILCLLGIQMVNPDLNSFKVTIKKNSPTINVLDTYMREYANSKNIMVIMPYLSNDAKKVYRNINFFDFDFGNILKSRNQEFLKQLIDKTDSEITNRNIYFVVKDYLLSNKANDYFAKYFIYNCLKYDVDYSQILLFVDKTNFRPLSIDAIKNFANNKEYNIGIRKLDFNLSYFPQNTNKQLYNALASKTLYNFIDLLNANLSIKEVVLYKRVKNKYYKIPIENKTLYEVINSPYGDYLFVRYVRK